MLKEMFRKETIEIDDISGADLIFMLIMTMIGTYVVAMKISKLIFSTAFRIVDSKKENTIDEKED